MPDDRVRRDAAVLELSGTFLREWTVAGRRVGVGPVAGHSWLDRHDGRGTAGGFVAGGAAHTARRWTGPLEVQAYVSLAWAAYARPGTPLPGQDDRAVGRRLDVGVGLSYRWKES